MRVLELQIAVELELDDNLDICCVLSANQIFRIRTISLAVVSLNIEV